MILQKKVKNLKRYIKDKLDAVFILLLIFIGFISHLEWFHFGNVLTAGDILFQHANTLKETILTNTKYRNI